MNASISHRKVRKAMSDLISRQAAIDAIRKSTEKYAGFMEMEQYTDDDAVDAINSLPSEDAVNKGVFDQIKWERDVALRTLKDHDIGFGEAADRPTGKWEIKTETDKYGLKRPKLVCSKCKKEPAAWDLSELFEFCPNCGTKMEVKK